MTAPRTPAPDLTPDQQARVDVFDAAGYPAEVREANGNARRLAWFIDGELVEELRYRAVILCGPPKGCTCPAVAWYCICEASIR